MSAVNSKSEGTAAIEGVPLVTVVVPVLNGEAYLRESLDSILGQTYPRFEVIVMDDASTDSTPAIARSYAERVRYVRQPATRGQFGNVNDGVALARGELIGVFHADDVYAPEMLAREVAWLEAHPTAGAVFCSDVFVNAEGREIGRLVLPPEITGGVPLDYSTILNAILTHTNTFLRCPTALVRASVYREVGTYREETSTSVVDLGLENTSDLEMWLRIARLYNVGVLEEHLLWYRRGHGSVSERYHHIRTEPFRFFNLLDAELESGGRDVATTEALCAYEAHRNVDTVLRAVNHYILGERAASLAVLREVRLRTLARSRSVQRVRMIALAIGLHGLVRFPRIAVVARMFERRWHGTRHVA